MPTSCRISRFHRPHREVRISQERDDRLSQMRIEAFLRSWAHAAPERIAVTAGDMPLSYGDLDHKSDRLASALLARGVKRGDRVVIFMDNIWEMPVAIFGVL